MEAAIFPKKSIFDTRFDTKRIFVTARSRFSLRGYKNKQGNSLIYLDVSDSKKRIRLNTEIEIPAKCWDPKKQRIINFENTEALNLVLRNIESKLTAIRTTFMLQERILDAETLVNEFQTETPEFDFISFYRHHLALQDYKKQTLKNHRSVIKKLTAIAPQIPFYKINIEFLQKYRKTYSYNSEVTYNSDLKCMKKFLKIAKNSGIKLYLNLDDVKVNVQVNRSVYLFPEEMKRLLDYYYNEFINPTHILPLGYLLLSCYTGMRISDIQKRTREEILGDKFQFSSVKTDNPQYMRLNADARKMVEFRPELLAQKLVDQKINFHLKAVATICKINKNLTMHVGRHTFATTFIRNKGDIYRLQKFLGHTSMRHTVKYVHLVSSEVLDDLDLVTY